MDTHKHKHNDGDVQIAIHYSIVIIIEHVGRRFSRNQHFILTLEIKIKCEKCHHVHSVLFLEFSLRPYLFLQHCSSHINKY